MVTIPDPVQRIHHHPTWSPDVPSQKRAKTQNPVDNSPVTKNHLSGYTLTRSVRLLRFSLELCFS